jgi:chromosome segregation ATPase
LEALEDVNLALQTKLKSLEELRLNYLEGNTASLQSHISSSLEILCTEVATEVHFTSHLNQLIEKMNKRRLDQEENISIIRSELKEARENMKSTSLELLKCKSLLENETRFKLNLENEILMLKNALNGLNDAKNNSELTLKSLSGLIILILPFLIC